MAKSVGAQELRRLARVGAQARLEELDRERSALLRMFPELARGRRTAPAAAGTNTPTPPRRRRMSAAERKAVSDRMKRYWAERKKKR